MAPRSVPDAAGIAAADADANVSVDANISVHANGSVHVNGSVDVRVIVGGSVCATSARASVVLGSRSCRGNQKGTRDCSDNRQFA
jgi:hypothetical protein